MGIFGQSLTAFGLEWARRKSTADEMPTSFWPVRPNLGTFIDA